MNTNQMLKYINVLANVSESRSPRLRPRVRSSSLGEEEKHVTWVFIGIS